MSVVSTVKKPAKCAKTFAECDTMAEAEAWLKDAEAREAPLTDADHNEPWPSGCRRQHVPVAAYRKRFGRDAAPYVCPDCGETCANVGDIPW